MIETNKDRLIKTAVMGEIRSPWIIATRGYTTSWDGKPFIIQGLGGIKYNLKVGDSCFGWAWGEHIEPGVLLRNKDSSEHVAFGSLSCIGNKAVVVTGEGKGAKGVVTGKHGDLMVYFKDEDIEKLAIGDKVQVKAWGMGLQIKGFEDVRTNKLSPTLLESIDIKIEGEKLVVPVTLEIPPFLMGSGIGFTMIEPLDYDIQTTCPEAVKEYGLEKLRLGDLVLLKDQLCYWGAGYYKGAMTVGVVIHGASRITGHGPGVCPMLSSKDGKIKTRIDPYANIAYYLGLREKPKK